MAMKLAIEKLMRIHYQHFMANSRFWYDKNLIDADALICIAASNIRLAAIRDAREHDGGIYSDDDVQSFRQGDHE